MESFLPISGCFSANNGLLILLLVVFDFSLQLLEKTGIDDSFTSPAVGYLLKLVDLGDFLIVFLQKLVDLVLHLLHLLFSLAPLSLVLLLFCCLVLEHLAFEQADEFD